MRAALKSNRCPANLCEANTLKRLRHMVHAARVHGRVEVCCCAGGCRSDDDVTLLEGAFKVCQRTRPDLLQDTWRRSVDRQQAIHRHPQVTCMRQGYGRSLEKGAQVDVMTCTHIRALPSGMQLFTITVDLRRDNLQNV